MVRLGLVGVSDAVALMERCSPSARPMAIEACVHMNGLRRTKKVFPTVSLLVAIINSIMIVRFALSGDGWASSPTVGTTYYFSESQGDDHNGCMSVSAPCRSISKLNSLKYVGGDMIAFRGGDTWTLTSDLPAIIGPNSTGRNQNYIPNRKILTITTYGSGTCSPTAHVTSGCATFRLSGQSPMKGIWNIHNASNVLLENILVIGGTSSALKFQAGSGILIDNDQDSKTAGITVRNVGVEDDANLILVHVLSGTIDNLSIENSYLAGSSRSETVDNGILIKGNLSACTIQRNVITNIGGHPSSAPGYYGGGSGNGILISDGAKNCIVQFNHVSYFGGNVDSCGGPAGIWTYIASNVTIQYNESDHGGPIAFTTGCDWDGFDIDAGSSNVVVQYNYSHDNYGAGLNWYQCDRGINFQNDVYRYNISETDSSFLSMGAVAIGGCNDTSTHGGIYNNTIYTHGNRPPSAHLGLCVDYSNNTDVLFANNICANDNNDVMIYLYAGGVSKFAGRLEGNDYYQANGQPEFRGLSGSILKGLAAWRSSAGQDFKSVNSNPRFVRAGKTGKCPSPDRQGPRPCPDHYMLGPGSPLIGAGLDLTLPPYGLRVGKKDYYGNAIPHLIGSGYNIGAYGRTR
jgi:hypothetical protein